MACGHGLYPTHCHGHHVAAGALQALLHGSQAGVLAGAGEEAAVEVTPSDQKGIRFNTAGIGGWRRIRGHTEDAGNGVRTDGEMNTTKGMALP